MDDITPSAARPNPIRRVSILHATPPAAPGKRGIVTHRGAVAVGHDAREMRALFPRKEVLLVSRLAPDEVVRALEGLVGERRLILPWERVEKPFHGWVRWRQFEIRRVSKLIRASALPVVEGEILSREGGSAVRLLFRPAWAPAANVLWLAALVIPALLAIRGMWTVGLPDPFLLLVVVMSALGWLATTRWFAREVAIAIALLAPIGAPERSSPKASHARW
ncbi:MAG TPA: hypothetical protein VFP50_06360 [Anaeromyxobacteraceae bacterium]|nr:hypothetical protein [Anaeromyxobacteraceae bacterium]